MKKNLNRDTAHIRIFRFFSAGVSLVFFMMLISSVAFGTDTFESRKSMMLFTLTFGILFFYLSIPGLNDRLKELYLPPALFAASVLPVVIINIKNKDLLKSGYAVNTTSDAMTVTLLLIFPLVITAWQYSFPVVFLFFMVLGLLDPILLILISGTMTDEIYEVLNTSILRILALGAVGFMITELRHRQQNERRALEQANRKLEEYARASEQLTASRERNRLARDLHDTLAHTLSGLAIQMEAAAVVAKDDDSRVGPMIERARVTVREGLAETRRALKALRAAPPEESGLPAALQRLADDAAERGSAEITAEIPQNIPNWNEQIIETVYRIAQESLENTVRHSQATQIRLRLSGTEDQLQLSVQDNGRGFEPVRHFGDGRYGLQGMAERAEIPGGRLTVNSARGKGTTVTFIWRHE